VKKVLKIIWVLFSAVWTTALLFAFFLGAGMSPGDSNEGLGFLAYWLVPIIIPFVIYKLVCKYRGQSKVSD